MWKADKIGSKNNDYAGSKYKWSNKSVDNLYDCKHKEKITKVSNVTSAIKFQIVCQTLSIDLHL